MFYSITQQGFTNIYKNIFLSLNIQIDKNTKAETRRKLNYKEKRN